ncbi:hypothetical protein HDU82_001403 [Entophlyctis luteolus]|nr:hypothetical protein HDU82_001403 [Entophlyctis luteolus]
MSSRSFFEDFEDFTAGSDTPPPLSTPTPTTSSAASFVPAGGGRRVRAETFSSFSSTNAAASSGLGGSSPPFQQHIHLAPLETTRSRAGSLSLQKPIGFRSSPSNQSLGTDAANSWHVGSNLSSNPSGSPSNMSSSTGSNPSKPSIGLQLSTSSFGRAPGPSQSQQTLLPFQLSKIKSLHEPHSDEPPSAPLSSMAHLSLEDMPQTPVGGGDIHPQPQYHPTSTAFTPVPTNVGRMRAHSSVSSNYSDYSGASPYPSSKLKSSFQNDLYSEEGAFGEPLNNGFQDSPTNHFGGIRGNRTRALSVSAAGQTLSQYPPKFLKAGFNNDLSQDLLSEPSLDGQSVDSRGAPAAFLGGTPGGKRMRALSSASATGYNLGRGTFQNSEYIGHQMNPVHFFDIDERPRAMNIDAPDARNSSPFLSGSPSNGGRMRALSSVSVANQFHNRTPAASSIMTSQGNQSPAFSGGPMFNRPRASTVGNVDRSVIDGIDLFNLRDDSLAQQYLQIDQQRRHQFLMEQQQKKQFALHHQLQHQSDMYDLQMQFPSQADQDQQEDFQTPSRSLWVGNLDSSITAPEILSIFNPFGPIESLRMLPDKECVFVNFVNVTDAQSAKAAMTGRKIGSAVVRLGFGRNEAVGDTQGMQPTKSVWVGNIPAPLLSTASNGVAELEHMFSAFGPVESCRVLTHKSCGFVNFENLADAMAAQEAMNGYEIMGVPIKVGFAKVPSKVDGVAVVGGSTSVGMSVVDRTLSTKFSGNSGSRTGSVSSMGQLLDTLAITDESLNTTENSNDSDNYAPSLIALPESSIHRKVDQSQLREMRKWLENPLLDLKDVVMIFNECFDDAVELCTDYIGNVVLQKLIDKSDESYRCLLIEKLSPYLATLGVHKNGTWVVQKVIDSARTSAETILIVKALRQYAPCLLLDQFGNYVVQCCLRLGVQGNSFIFDAMSGSATRCVEIATGRFGARAMRSCLESQYTSKRQQKQVAIAISACVMRLVCNPNGNIIVTWLLDTSGLVGRYRILAPKFASDIAALCRNKLGAAAVLKIIAQKVEPDARELLLQKIFFGDDNGLDTLREILSDHVQGVPVVQKILSPFGVGNSGGLCVSIQERMRLADRVRACMAIMAEVKTNPMAYRKLAEDVASIPSLVDTAAGGSSGATGGDGGPGPGADGQPLSHTGSLADEPVSPLAELPVGPATYAADSSAISAPVSVDAAGESVGFKSSALSMQRQPSAGSRAYGGYVSPQQQQQRFYNYRESGYQ